MKTRTAVLVILGCSLAIGLPGLSEEEIFASPLHEVLALVPALVTSPMILFTDWSLIKAYTGMEAVTSNSSEEERLALWYSRCFPSTISRNACFRWSSTGTCPSLAVPSPWGDAKPFFLPRRKSTHLRS